MDRICSRRNRCRHNRCDIQVTLFSKRWPDADTLGCQLYMKRVFISLGVNCNRLNPKLMTRTDDSKGYLTAICDEDLLKRRNTHDY
jgi:hypothetical protein